MVENQNVKNRLISFIKYLGIGQGKFEKECGLGNGYVNNIRVSITPNKLQSISLRYPELNQAWLLTGEGEMLKGETSHEPQQDGGLPHSLPLIPISVVAGFSGTDNGGITLNDCTLYDVPEFAQAKADFLIRVSGSSMYPKYSSGDVLACRKIDEITFVQWGKVYVIDSRQGQMVKRLMPAEGDDDNLMCVSDNDKYPPFKLSKSEIRSLSIVVGVIRME